MLQTGAAGEKNVYLPLNHQAVPQQHSFGLMAPPSGHTEFACLFAFPHWEAEGRHTRVRLRDSVSLFFPAVSVMVLILLSSLLASLSPFPWWVTCINLEDLRQTPCSTSLLPCITDFHTGGPHILVAFHNLVRHHWPLKEPRHTKISK